MIPREWEQTTKGCHRFWTEVWTSKDRLLTEGDESVQALPPVTPCGNKELLQILVPPLFAKMNL